MTDATAPAVSVITAVHPRDAGYMEDAFASLLAQTCTRWEWVIQEDGGAGLLAGWGTRDPRVRYATESSATGAAATRNLAAFRATAPVLRNLDADDMLASPTVLGHTLDVFDRNDVEWMTGPVLDLLEDGTVTPFDEIVPAGRVPAGTLLPLWEGRNRSMPVHPTSLALRRGAFDAFGPYPAVPYGEDTALLLPMSEVTDGWFASVPVAVHRKRAGSMTGRLTDDDRRVLEATREFTARRARAAHRHGGT